MKKLLLAITVLCVLTQCDEASYRSADPVDPGQPDLSAVNPKIIDADNRFGLELFKQLVAADPDDNVFISPVSIATALAMTANGANGNTLTQMTNTLGFEGLDQEDINQSFKSLINYLVNRDPEVMTEIANSIWYDYRYSFVDAFLETNQNYFDAYIQGLNFSDDNSADIINGWVDDKTHGLIDQIVDKPIDPELVMFLINAIYFKGTWTYQFADTMTIDDWLFTNQDGSQTQVPMMRGDFLLDYFSNDDVTMVRLPYGDEKYSMLVLLPPYGTPINQFVDNLDQATLADWAGGLEEDTIIIGLPRFTMDYDKKLNDVLMQMGMVDPFISGLADFSKMSSQYELFISLVKHKSFIEVNEEGTVAAAVTVVGIGYTSIGPKTLIADRPFLFMIQDDESGTILFVGKAGLM